MNDLRVQVGCETPSLLVQSDQYLECAYGEDPVTRNLKEGSYFYKREWEKTPHYNPTRKQ